MLRAGRNAEIFFALYLRQRLQSSFNPATQWLSSTRRFLYPDLGIINTNDAAGYDFVVEGALAHSLFGMKGLHYNGKFFVEVKGSIGPFPGFFMMSANEIAKMEQISEMMRIFQREDKKDGSCPYYVVLTIEQCSELGSQCMFGNVVIMTSSRIRERVPINFQIKLQ